MSAMNVVMKPELTERLRDEASLCRTNGADSIADLLEEATTELESALEAMIVAIDTGDFLLINQYIRHKAGDK